MNALKALGDDRFDTGQAGLAAIVPYMGFIIGIGAALVAGLMRNLG
ncbi:hypothetical protein DW66_2648 [Pseudomonas putida]|nr:hypothetical protein DW66_2648 [Pseudomonas putida]